MENLRSTRTAAVSAGVVTEWDAINNINLCLSAFELTHDRDRLNACTSEWLSIAIAIATLQSGLRHSRGIREVVSFIHDDCILMKLIYA